MKIPALIAASLMLGVLSPTASAYRDRTPASEVRTLVSGGLDRTYLIHKPKAASGPRPVVIMLHGGGGNSWNGVKMSGLNDLAKREGFIAVYPQGTAARGNLNTWNAGHCCAYAMEENVDDVGFVSDLIDELVARGEADPKAVYVTGMSNGAMMTYRLGRELPGKIAAIAPVVGAMFGDEEPIRGPMPALIITGALDKNVPAAGGRGDIGRRRAPADMDYALAEYAASYWGRVNACGDVSREVDGPLNVTRYNACADGADVVWYHIADNGHAWPGGEKGYRRGDPPSGALDASQTMWNFFKAHREAD